MFPGKVFELILRFSEVLGVVRIIQSVQHAFDYTFYLPSPFLEVQATMTDALEIRCLSGCELHGNAIRISPFPLRWSALRAMEKPFVPRGMKVVHHHRPAP